MCDGFRRYRVLYADVGRGVVVDRAAFILVLLFTMMLGHAIAC